jgi:AcrR family transcriptional regulator
LVDLTLGEGYARVSEVQLARRAGISVGTFHEHFSDTGQCLLAALDEFFGEALVAARDALERGTAWPQAVDSAMRAFVGHLVADPDLLRIAFVDLFELGPGIVGRLAGWVEAFTGLLTKAGPPPRRGPALALEAVTGAIWAVMATYVAGDRPARLPALTEQLTFLVLAPYIGPKAAIEAIQQTGMQPRAA